MHDLIGRTFGRLTVTGIVKGKRQSECACICECGETRFVPPYKLKSGHTQSCGCIQKESLANRQRKHGRYYEPEYRVWSNMHKRCSDPRFATWYGHVRICDAWRNYDAFLVDVGRKPSPEASFDRIDGKGHYEPGNVRWTSHTVQSRNTKLHSTNSTGERGVSWSKTKDKWRAAIYVDNKQKHLGYYTSFVDAVAARERGEQLYWKDTK